MLRRRRIWGVLVLLLLTGASIWSGQQKRTEQETAARKEAAYQQLLVATPVAEMEGQAISPDGRFEARTAGATDNYVSGVRPPEFIQFVDRETGEILWEDRGWLSQSVLWSPDSAYVALRCAARTWEQVRIIETETWTSWEFTLPDDFPIPEYTFLPYDQPWGVWEQKDVPRGPYIHLVDVGAQVPPAWQGKERYTLCLTVGRGGDDGEQHTYACALVMDQGQLTGTSLEVTREVLPESWDFDGDGQPETVGRWMYHYPGQEAVELVEVRIQNSGGDLIWKEEAASSHAGENAVYACRVDGQDCLVRYDPYMGQGYCNYHYQLFTLDGKGGATVLRENSVDFDVNWNHPTRTFDTQAIAAFLQEVHGLLDSAEMLADTTFGEIYIGPVDYGDVSSIEAGLQALEAKCTAGDALFSDRY